MSSVTARSITRKGFAYLLSAFPWAMRRPELIFVSPLRVKNNTTSESGNNAKASNAHCNLNMPDSSGYERFTDLLKLTDRMINDAPKSAIAEAARMFAIQVGHYQRKFGVLPFEEAIELLETETLDDEQAG